MVSALPADQRAEALREEIKKRAPCVDLEEVRAALLDDALHRDCRRLAREVSTRLAECDCPRDGGAVAALMSIVSEARLPSVAAPASLDARAKPPEGETWADIVGNLREADMAALWVDGA